ADDPPLINCTALLIASVGGMPSKRCTWLSIPPIITAFMSFSRAMPPRYDQTRSSMSACNHGSRFLVLKMMWQCSEVNVLAMSRENQDWHECSSVAPRRGQIERVEPWDEYH